MQYRGLSRLKMQGSEDCSAFLFWCTSYIRDMKLYVTIVLNLCVYISLFPRLGRHTPRHEAHEGAGGHLQRVHGGGRRENPQHPPPDQHCLLPHQHAGHVWSPGDRVRVPREPHWLPLHRKPGRTVLGEEYLHLLVVRG